MKNEMIGQSPGRSESRARLTALWLVLAVVLLLTALARGAADPGYAMDWCTLDSGGELNMTDGYFGLSGTIGQPDAVRMSGGNFEMYGGFWVPAVVSAPFVVGAESCRLHRQGTPEEIELCIDLIVDNALAVEPRQLGARKLAFTMSESLDPESVVAENVQVECANQNVGNWTVELEGDREVVVEFPGGLVDVDCCRVGFEGIRSAMGGGVTETFDFVTLEGDLDFSAAVTGGDAARVKPHLGEIAGVNLAGAQWDFDCSGAVTGGDYALLKPKLGHQAPPCP